MKWLIVLVAAGVAVYGWRWLERRLQRRYQPRRSSPGSTPQPSLAKPTPPPAPPQPAAPAPPAQGFSHGLSAVADDTGPPVDPTPTPTPTPEPEEEVGSFTLDDWGLKTVRQDEAPAPPEPEAEAPPEPPAEAPLTTEFAGAPTALLLKVTAAVEAGEAPDTADVEKLAADPLSRAAIYGTLKEARKASLIPRKLRTREAMAEADLVTWLVDSRLGRPPSAIEQVQVYTRESDGGPMDWYLFRFRSQRRSFVKRGWMAGVSGPWIRSDGPGGGAGGDTGSDFLAWDSMSEEEHAATVRELMEAWSDRA